MRICLLILFITSSIIVFGQDSTIQFSAGIVISGSTDQTPYWISTRQYGAIPIDGSFAMGQFGLNKRYHPNNPRTLQWSGKAEAIVSYSQQAKVFFTDLYLAGKIGPVEILAGQQKYSSGLVLDSTLTSGSISMSGNARPFPKIQISIPEYLSLGFTNNYVALKASYSDGILQGSDINYGKIKHVDRTYFHQKSLYIKLGQPSSVFQFYTGFNHQAVWGGENQFDLLYKPGKAKAYWHTISGQKLDYKVIGNHLGTIDVGGTWKQNIWTLGLYRQTIFETGSLFRVTNFEDGLTGLSIKRNKRLDPKSTYFALLSGVFEVIGTKNQYNANPVLGLGIFEYGNYFNHYLYQNGWSYRGNNMGSPLIPPKENTTNDLPRQDNTFTNNNRLWAFHTGMTASWLNLYLVFKGTHSLNYGTHLAEFSSVKHQTSLFLSAQRRFKLLGGSAVSLGASGDFGSLLPNTYGVVLAIRKNIALN